MQRGPFPPGPFPRTLDTPEGSSPYHPEPRVGLLGPPSGPFWEPHTSGVSPSGHLPPGKTSGSLNCRTTKLTPAPGSLALLGYSHLLPLFPCLSLPRGTPGDDTCLAHPLLVTMCELDTPWALQLPQPSPLHRWVADPVLNLWGLGGVRLALLRKSVSTVSST